MAIAGMRGTDDWGSEERPQNFRELILWRDPNGQTPLTGLMSKMRSEVVNDPQFHWWEEALQIVRLTVNGAQTNVDTAIEVDSGALGLVTGDLLLHEVTTTTSYDHEILMVSADPTVDTAFTAARSQRGTTAVVGGIGDNELLTLIGNVNGEGSEKRTGTHRNPIKYTNYCQIFKTSYSISKTAAATFARTGDALKNDKKRKSFDHAMAQELAYLFGRSHEDTDANGEKRRSTGGLLEHLSALRATDTTLYGHCITLLTAATFTMDDVFDNMHKVFDWNANGAGNQRLVLAGNGALNHINKQATSEGTVQFNNGVVDAWKMKLTRWEFPQGTFFVRTHPLLNTHGRFKNGMFVINPAGVKHRYLTGRDTKFEDNIQTPGADRMEGQWIGEVGCEFHHLMTMQYIEFQ